MNKTINTNYQRVFEVIHDEGSIYLNVRETANWGKVDTVRSFLPDKVAVELATALLEAAGQEVTHTPDELPKVVEGWNDNRLHSNNVGANLTDDPKMVMKKALGLLAIAKELEKRQAEALERNKAEAKAEKEREEKLRQRREKLAQELSEGMRTYFYSPDSTRNAIDKIIELQDAAKPKFEL